ncbi:MULTISPECIES: membrane protein insertion efficiency factor YidD [Mesorhizobium]
MFHKALLEGRGIVAVSLAWAWISSEEITTSQRHRSSIDFGDISSYPEPGIVRLYAPHKITVVCAVVVYQHFLRFGSAFGPGDCPSVPNCSNYLVGCLTRYGLIESLKKTSVRIKACTGTREPRFSENFL